MSVSASNQPIKFAKIATKFRPTQKNIGTVILIGEKSSFAIDCIHMRSHCIKVRF